MAALSEGQDVVVLGEETRDLVPVPRVVHEAMQKNDRRRIRITRLAIVKSQLRKLDGVIAENGHLLFRSVGEMLVSSGVMWLVPL